MPVRPRPPQDVDAAFMALALVAARRAQGRTAPNPQVGCVVVRRGRVVGVGHHVRAGTAHAEVVALRRAGAQARGADLYVTLEPCHHTGRTGPCTAAILAAGVKRVIVGARDPDPRVDGRGLRALRRAGVMVAQGVLRGPCTEMNEAFNHAVVARRAFVVAKLAQSLDGCVATASGMSQWITQVPARRAGHALRNALDAILVGSGTVLADDPQLTCRMRGGRDPLRVVLDGRARTPPTARVVHIARTSAAPTLICVGAAAPQARRRALEEAGAEVWECPARAGVLDVAAVAAHLFDRGLLSVLVEGGPQVQGAFFDAKLVDRVAAFIAPSIVGGVGARHAVGGRGCADLMRVPRLVRPTWVQVGDDWTVSGRVAYGPEPASKGR